MCRIAQGIVIALLGLVVAAPAAAMERPTAEQLGRYRADGTLEERADRARRSGNHLVAPGLVARYPAGSGVGLKADPSGPVVLPSIGNQRIFALLVGFSDFPGRNPVAEIDRRLFGAGPVGEHPYESLRDYYLRSSYGLLELEGVTLGWYNAPYRQAAVRQTDEGREALIREVIDHYDSVGHDFSQYDNDGDGRIDYFLVFYAGPHQEWGDFWWGYQRQFEDTGYVVDGMRLGAYSWQWEAWEVGGPFSARVAIHETGHALGLPDYYDYDDEIGPMGGLGGLDMMDNNWGDHNAFSKILLGWVEPAVVNEGLQRISLRPSSESGDAVILMHGDPVSDPFGEYFVAQYRWRTGNDADHPTDGILIWHIDARRDDGGRFLSDNSYTEHKLIRLMEADGLEEIEQDFGADAGDYYGPGDAISSVTVPNSDRYDGAPTNLVIDEIERRAGAMALDADLGSGCGIFAEVPEPVTGWPGLTTSFRSRARFENCHGSVEPEWFFSDGVTVTGAAGDRVFPHEGNFSWELRADLGDASLRRRGEALICDDPRCFQWRPEAEMRGLRLQHSAVVLDDGSVLVVGGGPPPEVFDSDTGRWLAIPPGSGVFGYASAKKLLDGRVLVTGSTPGDPVNAEIYDPASGVWTEAGRMSFDRVMHSTVVLADGRVLVAGGVWGSTGVLVSELYDPRDRSWETVGGTGPEEVPGLVLLNDGEVLFVGKKATRLFNPVTETWRRISDTVHEHRYGATVALPDGRAMVVGGEGTAATEVFDPDLNLWRPNPPLNGIRAVPSAVVLAGGEVVVSGGADRFWRIGSGVEVFDPATGIWTEVRSMAARRLAHTMSVLGDGSVLVTGGTTAVLEEPFVGQKSVERFVVPAESTRPRGATGRQTP
jgi:M6 family metalloprotease-like protein